MRLRPPPPDPVHPALVAELARLGWTWGAMNATEHQPMSRTLMDAFRRGGPSLVGCHLIGESGFRRLAAPAP